MKELKAEIVVLLREAIKKDDVFKIDRLTSLLNVILQYELGIKGLE